MNNNSVNKINLLLLGISNRFSENSEIFKSIEVTFKTGLKNFNGIGKYKDGLIAYNYNGVTEAIGINDLINKVAEESKKYDAVTISYTERSSVITIHGDNKDVKMSSKDLKSLGYKDKNVTDTHNNGETSTILNRNYYINSKDASSLLKAIGIMSSDGKIKNDKVRKYNQIDHYIEILDDLLNSLPKNETVNILDCGCGKSYLTFVLNYYLTEVKKVKCHFIGLDYSKAVIDASKKIAKTLDYRNMDFYAVDIKDYTPSKKIHMVISLHACDTATDMALAFGIRVKASTIVAVPCCHRELLNQYTYEPFKDIIKHGVFKARLADVLTDGMRSLMLEAHGYDTSVIEYISPIETPKNLMIRAIKKREKNDEARKSYMKLMNELNVSPALYNYILEYNEDV